MLREFRIFTNDVGARRFSGLKDVKAKDYKSALGAINGLPVGTFIIALPHTRRDLWPDGKTGRVPPDALSYGGEIAPAPRGKR